MKENVIKVVFGLISFGLFIAMIVYTNDWIKNRIDTCRIIPMIGVLSIALIATLLLWIKIKVAYSRM